MSQLTITLLLALHCRCSIVTGVNSILVHTKYIQKNTILMFVFWVSVIITSSFNALFQAEVGQLTSQLLMVIFIYAASYAWFVEDAKTLGIVPSKALKFGVITAASICIPYYLVRHKGIKRSLFSAGKFAGLFVVTATLFGAMSH